MDKGMIMTFTNHNASMLTSERVLRQKAEEKARAIEVEDSQKTQYRISCYELSIGGSAFQRCAS
jgi:hypothetical protein